MRAAMTMTMVAVVLAQAGTGRAEDKPANAPALLEQALRRGAVDADAAAEITRWILSEKDEAVARGLLGALRSADLAPPGPDRELWIATTDAMLELFESGLGDAAVHRRRAVSDWPELAVLVDAAAPAIAAALRETSPSDRQALSRFLGAVAPTARPMVPSLIQGLRHERAEVRLGAAMALGAMGAAGRPAADELRRALDDPDAEVRVAAADALRRVEGPQR
jgi:HEAT repeat protein